MTETSADRDIDATPVFGDADPHADDTRAEDTDTEVRFEDADPAAAAPAMVDADTESADTADVETRMHEAAASEDETAETGSGNRIQQLEEEGDIAADYLEGLLDLADQDGDIDLDVEGDRASVSIVGDDLTVLVGEGGSVLEALQELTRLAVYRETGERSRLMLDIGGFRADKRKALESLARDAAEEVRETGEAIKLSPMTPFERKVVHDAVADQGLRSESEGVEPARCVVVMPAE
jgi:spoIIIJ-associated protein